MKRLLTMLLLAAMLLMPLTGASAEEAPETVHVGFVCWGYSDLLSTQYVRYLDYLAENMNLEITYATAYSSEEHVATTENLISAGVDVILDYDCYAAMMELCENAGVYLAQYSLEISSPELKETLEGYSHWLGYSVCDDYESGCYMAKAMYDQGCRNIALLAIAPGSAAADLRWNGVVDTVAQYDDYNIIAEYRNDDTGEFGPALSNMIALYGNLDGVILMGSSDGAYDAVIQTLEIEGLIGEIKFATVDVDENSRVDMERGALHVIGGGQFIDPGMLLIPVYNAVTGSPMTDGPFTLYGKNIFIEGPEDFDIYETYIEGDVFPYTFEELKPYLRMYNPEATFEDFAEFYDQYSLDEVVTRHADLVG